MIRQKLDYTIDRALIKKLERMNEIEEELRVKDLKECVRLEKFFSEHFKSHDAIVLVLGPSRRAA